MENKMLTYWQGVLNLTDWDIVLTTNLSYSDMSDENCSGECHINEVNKQAVIKIVSEEEYYKFAYDRRFAYNFEQILLHELLHIKFKYLEDSGNELRDRILHRTIEDMAKTLHTVRTDKESDF